MGILYRHMRWWKCPRDESTVDDNEEQPQENLYIITPSCECGKADEHEEEQEQPAAGARSLGAQTSRSAIHLRGKTLSGINTSPSHKGRFSRDRQLFGP
jgi:hypothetical protein